MPRIFLWKSVEDSDCHGIFQGDSEDLIDVLQNKKVAANISITDITDGVLSEYGWKNGSMDDEPFTIHVDGVPAKNSRATSSAGIGSKPTKKQKIHYDNEGNVIPKVPRKPSPYNLFVKQQVPLLKEQYPYLKHQEIFPKIAELWKLNKASQQESGTSDTSHAHFVDEGYQSEDDY